MRARPSRRGRGRGGSLGDVITVAVEGEKAGAGNAPGEGGQACVGEVEPALGPLFAGAPRQDVGRRRGGFPYRPPSSPHLDRDRRLSLGGHGRLTRLRLGMSPTGATVATWLRRGRRSASPRPFPSRCSCTSPPRSTGSTAGSTSRARTSALG